MQRLMPRQSLMTKTDKAQKIGEILDDLYPEPPIPLEHKDGYTLLVAVLLSAQCTDKRVNMVTPDLFDLADNPHDMAERSVDEIKHAIRSCGLAPTKAKRIKKLSQMLVEDMDAELPDTLTGLTKLPGVGRKTAQVVLAQRFDVPSVLSGRYPHPPAGRALGLVERKERAPDRKGPQGRLRRGDLEPASPPDHLLRSRALPGARSRSVRMPHLQLGNEGSINHEKS